jgi:hypothetical protein
VNCFFAKDNPLRSLENTREADSLEYPALHCMLGEIHHAGQHHGATSQKASPPMEPVVSVGPNGIVRTSNEAKKSGIGFLTLAKAWIIVELLPSGLR